MARKAGVLVNPTIMALIWLSHQFDYKCGSRYIYPTPRTWSVPWARSYSAPAGPLDKDLYIAWIGGFFTSPRVAMEMAAQAAFDPIVF